MPEESPIIGEMFFITSSDPWYGYVLVYLHNLRCHASASHDESHCIHHQSKNYLILEDTLYHLGVDCVLHQCITHEEEKIVLNDCHTIACGSHLSGMEIT
jgi:hypothetical protein